MTKNKVIGILIILVVAFIAFWGFYLLLWKVTIRDIKNVEVSGVLYTKDKVPIKNQTLYIVSSIYGKSRAIET